MRILSKLRGWAETVPDRPAYLGAGRCLRYGELWEKAALLAAALSRLEAPSVLLWGEKEPEMLVGMIGCLLAGKAYVPISAQTPPERLGQLLRALGPSAALSAGTACPIPGSLSIAEMLSASPPDSLPLEPETGTAYIIFTSGSTGVPKGVPISRRNLDHFADWICANRAMLLPAPARVLNQASFSFDLSTADLYYSLCGGHTLCGMDPELPADPEALLAFLGDQGIQLMVCTPTFLKLCLTDRSFSRESLPSLKAVYSCGEVLENAAAEKLLRRFPGLRLINAYGPTEATSAVCAVEITPELAASSEPLPVGVPKDAACEIRIDQGEIVLKGESVFSGYLDGSVGGYFTETGTPCFRTGDLGTIKNGLLYCHGRGDRQIKWKGYRIEMDEIEHVLQSLDGIADCAVIAKRNDAGIVRFVKAFVVPETELSADALRERLKERLPAYMIPKSIQFIQELPVTKNGKIDRRKLETL